MNLAVLSHAGSAGGTRLRAGTVISLNKLEEFVRNDHWTMLSNRISDYRPRCSENGGVSPGTSVWAVHGLGLGGLVFNRS